MLLRDSPTLGAIPTLLQHQDTMSESVQNWRERWFYVKDEVATGQSTGLAPFNPEAELTKKRSWNNALS